MKNKLSITICIISYGQAIYLKECIAGLQNIFPHIADFIIVNNGIKDDWFKFDNLVQSLLPNSTYRIVHRKQSDLVGALQHCLTISQDEFIYFTAADDIPIGAGLIKALNTLHARSDLGAIICGGYAFWEDNDKAIRSVYNRYHVKCINSNFKYLKISPFLGFPKPVLIQSTVFKRAFLLEVNTWNCNYKLDDFPLYYKIITNAEYRDKILFQFDNDAVKYRRHSNNISNKQINMLDLVVSSSGIINENIRSLYKTEAAMYYLIQSIRNHNISFLPDYFKYISIKSVPLALINIVIFFVLARILGWYEPLPRQ